MHAYEAITYNPLYLCTTHADNSGTAPCCTPPEAGVVCGGSVSCNIPFKTGEEFLCVYIKMDGDDILEEDKTVTLNLTSGDGIVIRDPGELMLLVIDDDCELVQALQLCMPNWSTVYNTVSHSAYIVLLLLCSQCTYI